MRLRWLFGVKLHPRRIKATFAFLRNSAEIHRGETLSAERRRIAVDAMALWDNMTGIGWYLYKILEELKDRDDLELWLYGPPSYGHDLEPKIELPAGRAIRVIECPIPEDQSLPTALAFRLLLRREAKMVAESGCQVVWLPNFLEPERFSNLVALRVTTVHDLASVLFPETLRESRREELERELGPQIDRSAKILTPSESVRAEIIEHGMASASSVQAVLHGPGHLSEAMVAPLNDGVPNRGSEAEESATQHRVPTDFALHVGTLEPRKNVEFLVDVWGDWWRTGSDNFVPLVLCGGSGWKIETLQTKIDDGCQQGWLVRPGYVEDDLLARMYREARFSVSASLYEGFGLPLVESMIAGTAVMCSDIAVYREVTQEAALMVDLSSPRSSWLEALDRISGNGGLRFDLEQRGRARIANLSWESAGRATATVLLDAAQLTVGEVE